MISAKATGMKERSRYMSVDEANTKEMIPNNNFTPYVTIMTQNYDEEDEDYKRGYPSVSVLDCVKFLKQERELNKTKYHLSRTNVYEIHYEIIQHCEIGIQNRVEIYCDDIIPDKRDDYGDRKVVKKRTTMNENKILAKFKE